MPRDRLTTDSVMDLELYVLAYPTGDLVGLDEASGGYPWKPTNWSSVRTWSDLEAARKYVGVTNNERFMILRLTPVLSILEDLQGEGEDEQV